MRSFITGLVIALGLGLAGISAARAETWTSDNGNGTFTNPLFYDEFSDPDLIRVGDDYYLTGTTMHSMPGLPILHSKDLVNWTFLTYASPKLDLGPGFRLEDGKGVYGQGIWAPTLRYHDGTFYIFSNVNGQTTQVFTATDPKGPWTHSQMKRSFHDLSVLFDGGKAYMIWGYQGIRMAELNADLTDIVPGTEREIIPHTAGMGEGVHFYKLNGKYYITSAWFNDRMRMPAARADTIWGPYEVNQAISIDEDFGLAEGNRVGGRQPFLRIHPGNPAPNGRMSLHQGGLVQTPEGEWWGFSMMDYNSVGRLTALAPITWKDGWPYFGLPGNLTRNPRTWVKPKTKYKVAPHMPYERSDDFAGAALKPVWQWSHVPVDAKWSLTERPGHLRLHTLPAADFWTARNTLTQRAIGPQSTPTAVLDAAGLKPGDVAGLALTNKPYAWIGVERGDDGLFLVQFNEYTNATTRVKIDATRVWLRAEADFLTEIARFSWSTDGETFMPVGEPFTMAFQLITFQGVRYSLFAYNTRRAEGGFADFDAIDVHEPHPRGLMKPIPYGQQVRLTSWAAPTGLGVTDGKPARGAPADFTVVDMKLGRAALKSGDMYLTVAADGAVSLKTGKPGTAQSFQWIETPTGELALMSLVTNRFLRIDPQKDNKSGAVVADSPGPQSDGKDGVRFTWAPALKVALKPLYRDPVYDGAADVSIVWDEAQARWTMFYTNRRATMKLPDLKDVAWVHATPIGVATSADGLNWDYGGTAVFPAECTGVTLWAPEVFRDGDTYHMWLTIVPGIFNRWGQPGATSRIVHLTSPDLKSWSCAGDVELDIGRIIDAAVIKVGDRYRLWYKDETVGSRIMAADSPDLKTWKRISDSPVSQTAGEGPKVFRLAGKYWMVFDAWKGLAVLSSDDATTWVQQDGFILAEPGVKPTDRAKGQHPDVVVSGDRAFIYYFVHQGAEKPEDPHWNQRTVIQVAELKLVDGRLVVDRNADVDTVLTPPAKP
ncbi:family 43 glycosylhydrolase [Asticcacaulis sp. AC402]|uniref:family 43 glycosylhydrolase n=1 Tax=Asticcacaulis sp. AC402 TaxID=1282361 RepID=UPI0003C41123|nr:family 43 glycosylhydrolase [Asticcacaulis sp. AC402]ESQ73512.1 hypothetical protein ABAC402_18930 [Asticcacaulis sp. AC402]